MKKKSSITSKLRNAFIAGIVVLVPIGFTLYLTLFLIKISSKLIPNEINPNNLERGKDIEKGVDTFLKQF